MLGRTVRCRVEETRSSMLLLLLARITRSGKAREGLLQCGIDSILVTEEVSHLRAGRLLGHSAVAGAGTLRRRFAK